MSKRSAADRWREVRVFAAGAGCGLFAGLCLTVIVLWQTGLLTGLVRPRDTREVVPREAAVDDPGDAVIEAAPDRVVGTSGAPVIGPVPSSPGELADRDLEMPVEGVVPESLTRQFDDARGERRHEAIDILAPRNTPVKAVEDGRIARLFTSRAGGLTIYQFDPSEQYCYYYAHLERYANGLKEGDRVRKGQVIGYVGSSGNAPENTPHLHFAIFRLTAEKRWWEGTPIDPYDVLR